MKESYEQRLAAAVIAKRATGFKICFHTCRIACLVRGYCDFSGYCVDDERGVKFFQPSPKNTSTAKTRTAAQNYQATPKFFGGTLPVLRKLMRTRGSCDVCIVRSQRRRDDGNFIAFCNATAPVLAAGRCVGI